MCLSLASKSVVCAAGKFDVHTKQGTQASMENLANICDPQVTYLKQKHP